VTDNQAHIIARDEAIAHLDAVSCRCASRCCKDSRRCHSKCGPLPKCGRIIPGISRPVAPAIIAEIGPGMSRFPTPGHLVSWAKLTPRTIQSGAKSRDGKTGKGNPYLEGLPGEAAATAARTDTFPGERYRRLVRRRGKLKALVAIARTILVIIWHLLTDRTARFKELGAAYYANRINKDKKTRNHVRQLEAPGHTVTLAPAA
jgi:transposase